MTEKFEHALLTGNLWGLIAKYSFPSVTSMVGISLYILADTYFIANGIGELALASLNIAMPIYAVIACMGNMIGVGGATVYAIAREVGDRRTRDDVFTLCLGTVLAFGVLLSLLGLFFSREISLVMGASQETLAYTETYLGVLLLCAPAFVANNVLTAFIRNDGAPNLAMASMLGGVVFNIVFDYILIYIAGWGMFGAIAATCLSPVVSMGIISAHFLRRRNTFRLRRTKVSVSILLRVVRGGAATFVTEIAMGIVVLLFNFKLLALLGDLGVAAYGAIANLSYVVISIFNGMGQGIQPIVSSNYGAGQLDRCNQTLRNAAIAAFAVSLLLAGAILAFPQEIVALFNKDDNARLAQIAEQGVVVYFSSLFFCGVNIVAAAWYQAMLMSRAAILISMTRGLLGVIVGLSVLPRLFGATGIWMTAPFADMLGTVAVALLLVHERRREKREKTLV